jgi:transcriptional regulator with XRE-family HTH domain
MTLAQYKRSKSLSLAELAEQLGRPVSTVHSWVAGTRRPDWAVVADIEERTGGLVTAADFVPRKVPDGDGPCCPEAA